MSFTKEDVKELVAAAVAAAITEANKPKPLTEAERINLEQEQRLRQEAGEAAVARKANQRRYAEKVCSHEHSKAAGGGTHCVHVYDNDYPGSPGFILCQDCQGRFRPDSEQWRKLDPEAIFDTAKFNALYQACYAGAGEILA